METVNKAKAVLNAAAIVLGNNKWYCLLIITIVLLTI
jgi:hypothetical protein